MISANKIIGSLVYRTREELRKDKTFLAALEDDYTFAPNCFFQGLFNFWHFPGTHNEIGKVLIDFNKHPEDAKLKYPSLFNFQNIRQIRDGQRTTLFYNLAFVAKVKAGWLTEQREKEVFETLLRPIYKKFMEQIRKCGYFNIGFSDYPPHEYWEVFTTGSNQGELLKRYGDHIDAIEVHNLSLVLKDLCDSRLQRIDYENDLVTGSFGEPSS